MIKSLVQFSLTTRNDLFGDLRTRVANRKGLGQLVKNLILFKTSHSSSIPTEPSKSRSVDTNNSFNMTGIFWFEVIVVLAILFVYAGQLTPNVNETHYLTKAKHFWNPNWCPNDLFLGSSFPHLLFYISTGWLTLFCSLSSYAWIGRIACWTAFAIAWCRLNRSMGAGRWMSMFSIVLFLLLMDRFHMAGEWVIGGFEAKSISYVFVIFATDFLLRRQWSGWMITMGLACAFHVLVGGWCLLAMLFAILVLSQIDLSGGVTIHIPSFRDRKIAMSFLAFVLLALLGAVPPLLSESGNSAQTIAEAHNIYVHFRLPHHLLFGGFETIYVARFALMTCLWVPLAYFSRFDAQLRTISWFCVGALLVSLAGLVLSGIVENDITRQRAPSNWATSLLRFYWFRTSDFAIPLGLTAICSVLLHRWFSNLPNRKNRIRVIANASFCLLIIAAGLLMFQERWQLIQPRADLAALPNYGDNPVRTEQTWRNWKKACVWIRNNTPRDATFITPIQQQTFKWYAHRTEVVNRKDVPQNAADILEWKSRIDYLHAQQSKFQAGLLTYNDKDLLKIGNAFDADYLVVPQSQVNAIPNRLSQSSASRLVQVYPDSPKTKSTYVVIRLDRD